MGLPDGEIARRVRQQLIQRKLTLLKCCDAFNSAYSAEIQAGSLRRLNKDFLSRVSRSDFKVCTARISILCEFLDIREDSETEDLLRVLSEQVRHFSDQASSDAQFRQRYSAVEKFLSGLNFEKLLDER